MYYNVKYISRRSTTEQRLVEMYKILELKDDVLILLLKVCIEQKQEIFKMTYIYQYADKSSHILDFM